MLLTIKIINLYNINNSKFIYISPLGWTPSAGLFLFFFLKILNIINIL